jgi:cold shock CspA family protein
VFRTLTPGEMVEFEIKKDEKGLKAVNVTRAPGSVPANGEVQ